MKKEGRQRIAFWALALLALAALAVTPAQASFEEAKGEPIDLVIALDVSGSMDELIESARIKIWEIVNDLAQADPTPQLRVALVSYGNSKAGVHGGVRVETNLTSDLDLVSERLFALKSQGANEYVGRAIRVAVENLDWSESESALRLLFLAGNESPDQDEVVGFREMSVAAGDRGILVSAVFCGKDDNEHAAGWRELAELARGQYATISHKTLAVVVPTRFDRELGELGSLMNQTYIPVGKEGKERQKMRARQDRNAKKQGVSVAATRAVTKASPFYTPTWDLIEAVDSGRVDLLTVEDEDLPRSMRGMTTEERWQIVDDMRDVREQLRQRITDLSLERRKAVADRATTFRSGSGQLFDEVVRRTIREQAERKGFDFPTE